MRITEQERDHLVAVLRQHVGRGTIELDEFEQRVAHVMAATTVEDADEMLADLPPLVAARAATPAPAPRWWRRRRHGHADAGQAGWRRTSEIFRDPTTGVVTRVWVDPSRGTRHYVPEG